MSESFILRDTFIETVNDVTKEEKRKMVDIIVGYFHEDKLTKDITINDLLENIGIIDISIKDVAEIYMAVLSRINGDTFVHVYGESVNEDVAREAVKEGANFKIY